MDLDERYGRLRRGGCERREQSRTRLRHFRLQKAPGAIRTRAHSGLRWCGFGGMCGTRAPRTGTRSEGQEVREDFLAANGGQMEHLLQDRQALEDSVSPGGIAQPRVNSCVACGGRVPFGRCLSLANQAAARRGGACLDRCPRAAEGRLRAGSYPRTTATGARDSQGDRGTVGRRAQHS